MARFLLSVAVVVLWGAKGVNAGLCANYDLALASIFILMFVFLNEEILRNNTQMKMFTENQRDFIELQSGLICSHQETIDRLKRQVKEMKIAGYRYE